MKRDIMIGVLLGVLIIAVGAFFYVLEASQKTGQPTRLQVPDDLGGHFTLTDQDGKKTSSTVFADKYKLVYFGFTSCPAICPTELQKIAQAMQALGDKAAQVQPVFISVDPERDTPTVLKDYVGLFDMGLVGFTGTKEEIEAVKRQYRIYAAKVEVEGASDYAVDHSSYIYLLDKEDKVLDLFKTEDDAQLVADRVSEHLADK